MIVSFYFGFLWTPIVIGIILYSLLVKKKFPQITISLLLFVAFGALFWNLSSGEPLGYYLMYYGLLAIFSIPVMFFGYILRSMLVIFTHKKDSQERSKTIKVLQILFIIAALWMTYILLSGFLRHNYLFS